MNHPAKTIFFLCACFAISCFGLAAKKSTGKHPNMIKFMLDDVGYGDIGCFGGKRAATPHLDKMAAEGMRMTDFYVHPVCGVTRASLLTGSYAMRVAEVGNRKNGHPILHPKEITIAEVMREAGYRTGMVGKWHLAGSTRKEYPPELMPHTRLAATTQFKGKSKRGLYGDVIEEIDFNVGRVLDVIEEMDLSKNTYVLFTSDNGPWLIKNKNHQDGRLPGDHGGSGDPLRSGKVSTFEGGVRVPTVLWGPNRVPAGSTCSNPLTNMKHSINID